MSTDLVGNPIQYFCVKLLRIRQTSDSTNFIDYEIESKIKDSLWEEKNELVNERHYHPHQFVDYMKSITSNNPDIIFHVHFKYIFFNHPIDNEYHNTIYLKNDEMFELI